MHTERKNQRAITATITINTHVLVSKIIELIPISILKYYQIEHQLMIEYNKNINPSQLGPWIQGISYKEADELDEDKNIATIQNTSIHLHQRTTLKLPDILRMKRDSLSLKKSKNLLKVSHPSFHLDKSILEQTNSKSRYGALNGSFLHSFKTKGIKQQCKSSRSPLGLYESIQSSSLDRKVSMVRIGDPTINRRYTRGRKRALMNEECAKKRSLMSIIRESAFNKQLMNMYLLNKRQKGYQFNDI